MTNEQRKNWAYENLARDTLDATAAARNIAAFGAQRIIDVLGPTTWPETYGQTPWDNTYLLASEALRSTKGG